MHSPRFLVCLVYPVLLLSLSLAGCGRPPATPSSPDVGETPPTAAPLLDSARLSVQASPAGAMPVAMTPARTRQPSSQAGPIATTKSGISQITIPTYPYANYVSMAVDSNMGDYPVQVLDRAGYVASNPHPLPKTYKLAVLENVYMRLGILPELGGRVLQLVFKPTGNDELYGNPVIKPTEWGPPSPTSPSGANWWLAAGGIEWGFPVGEHGYE